MLRSFFIPFADLDETQNHNHFRKTLINRILKSNQQYSLCESLLQYQQALRVEQQTDLRDDDRDNFASNNRHNRSHSNNSNTTNVHGHIHDISGDNDADNNRNNNRRSRGNNDSNNNRDPIINAIKSPSVQRNAGKPQACPSLMQWCCHFFEFSGWQCQMCGARHVLSLCVEI